MFGKPRIEDPLRNTLFQIFPFFVLLKMVKKPVRSGYHGTKWPKEKKEEGNTTVQRMKKSRSNYLRPLNTH